MAQPDPAAILALEELRRQAMLAGDAVALRALLAPDLRYTHSTGLTDSRDSLLDKLASGRMRYGALRFEGQRVGGSADAALVSGEMHAQVLRGDAQITVAACTLAVWLRREGQWQLAAFQGTSLPAAT